MFAYPGSPEPIKFGERGAHGALVVNLLDDGSVALENVGMSRTQLVDVTVSLDDASDEGAVIWAC